jgi:hypothetical protein
MHDEKKWRLAVVQFRALHDHIPNLVQEKLVQEYHAILDLLAAASEEDLDSFRIPNAELKPRVTGGQIGGYRSPGKTFYSKDNFCDRNLFQRKLDSLANYLPGIEENFRIHARVEASKDYSDLNDNELESLAVTHGIRGHADGAPTIDRGMVIRELQKRDRPSVPTHQFINYGTMTGAAIQQGTSHSQATVNLQSNQIQSVLSKVKESIDQLGLNATAKNEMTADIETAESQLRSPNPKPAIVLECLRSARSILEGAAGSLLATGLAIEISKILGN